MPSSLLVWPTPSPTVSFTLLLLASWLTPPLCSRLKLPAVVGLLLAGVLLGPSGLQWLDPKGETLNLLSNIGKLYLMFAAGLEIDLRSFRQTQTKSLTFGLATFTVPLLTGLIVGRGFDYGWNASFLIGSLLASHTLLAYPIVQRVGLARVEAVTVTVGATIFTDIGALLVLAICIAVDRGQFSGIGLIAQIVLLGLYAWLAIAGVDRLAKAYFNRNSDNEASQFIFVLLVLFAVAVGAQVIQMENIVGAFLAGLAINDALGQRVVKEKLDFIGNHLFVPFFFTATGTLISISVFLQTLGRETALVAAIVLGLMGSKLVATFAVRQLYRYGIAETALMWSLSLPQVAATLAAALVGLEAGLLDEAVFNSVVVLMVVTSIAGPVLTQRYASSLVQCSDVNRSASR